TITFPVRSTNVYADDYVVPGGQSWLTDPSNTLVRVTDSSYTDAVNAGHGWKANVTGLLSDSYDPDGRWHLFLKTRKGLFKSPDLAVVAENRDQDKTVTSGLAGTDFTSWRAGTEGFTGPLFQFQNANQITDFVGLCAGAPVHYLGDTF